MDGAELAMCGGLLELGNHNQYMKNHYMCTFVYRILYNKNFSKKKRHKRLFLECSALWFFLSQVKW